MHCRKHTATVRLLTAARRPQPLDSFITKVIQLYEMIVVRHGLMMVGWSFGMKTAAIRVLAAALTDLNKAGLAGEFKVKTWTLNPKAVTMGQLYGEDDPVSKEWSDGVLAVAFRTAARCAPPTCAGLCRTAVLHRCGASPVRRALRQRCTMLTVDDCQY
jgi:dynein heavy chain, axonemal